MIEGLYFKATIHGTLKPRQSHRSALIKGKFVQWDPSTREKGSIRAQIVAQNLQPTEIIEGPVAFVVVVSELRPKSRKKDRYPRSRGDLDNYVKLVSDAFKGFIWKDDHQVVYLFAAKKFAENNEPPSLDIEVWQPEVFEQRRRQ